MGDRDWRIEVKETRSRGKIAYHWAAIDADGEVLDFLLTPTRDEEAAMAFFDKQLNRRGKRGIERSVEMFLKRRKLR